MTVPVVSERRGSLPWHLHLTARLATATAWLLVRLPPRRLRQVLRAASVGSRPADGALVSAARRAVVTVSPRCAGQGCLQRSVATVLLCRLRGRWADWCTGFRTQPFTAHAWVEAGGAAIGESADMTLFHTVLSVRRGGGQS